MNNKEHKKIYLKSINGINNVIDILNSSQKHEDKITLALRLLISTAQDCEDMYILNGKLEQST